MRLGTKLQKKMTTLRLFSVGLLSLTLLLPWSVDAQTQKRHDYGDAPDSYGTTLSVDGARHTIADSFGLGTLPDEDQNGQPTGQADGDNNNGVNDEDGVVFPQLVIGGDGLIKCQVNEITVTLVDALNAGAFLDGWVDYNGNGIFDIPDEHFSGGFSEPLNVGENRIKFPVPCDAVEGPTYARFRLSRTGGLLPTGDGGEGEVEDYRINLICLDFGDAPNSYGTTIESIGPSHVIVPGLRIGNLIDPEGDGIPSDDAKGDDNNTQSDEDGIPEKPQIIDVPGETVELQVLVTNDTAAPAYLGCWIDFNRNGTFSDDQLVQAVINPGTPSVTLSYLTPDDVVVGDSFIRCRLSATVGEIQNPTGSATSGEVEDCLVAISSNLPVELSTFTAEIEKNDAVRLYWSTLSEDQNAGFAIESSWNNGTFTEMAFVEGAGTTEEAQFYSYTVSDLRSGRYQFRLKQVDIDGSFEYSQVLDIRMDLPRAFDLEPAYPNPFNPSTQVRFTVAEREAVRLALYDASGRQLRVIYAGTPAAGATQTVRIDADGLASGIYLVRLEGTNFVGSQKIVLMK